MSSQKCQFNGDAGICSPHLFPDHTATLFCCLQCCMWTQLSVFPPCSHLPIMPHPLLIGTCQHCQPDLMAAVTSSSIPQRAFPASAPSLTALRITCLALRSLTYRDEPCATKLSLSLSLSRGGGGHEGLSSAYSAPLFFWARHSAVT